MKRAIKLMVLALFTTPARTFFGFKKDDSEISAITTPAIITTAAFGITTTSAVT